VRGQAREQDPLGPLESPVAADIDEEIDAAFSGHHVVADEKSRFLPALVQVVQDLEGFVDGFAADDGASFLENRQVLLQGGQDFPLVIQADDCQLFHVHLSTAVEL